jgi:hypothetical protein
MKYIRDLKIVMLMMLCQFILHSALEITGSRLLLIVPESGNADESYHVHLFFNLLWKSQDVSCALWNIQENIDADDAMFIYPLFCSGNHSG